MISNVFSNFQNLKPQIRTPNYTHQECTVSHSIFIQLSSHLEQSMNSIPDNHNWWQNNSKIPGRWVNEPKSQSHSISSNHNRLKRIHKIFTPRSIKKCVDIFLQSLYARATRALKGIFISAAKLSCDLCLCVYSMMRPQMFKEEWLKYAKHKLCWTFVNFLKYWLDY